MKLSELRVCDSCAGPLLKPGIANFYVIRATMALLNPQATASTLGLAMHFRGALGLAEVMSPDPEAVLVCGDEKAELLTELFLCFDCYCTPVSLAGLCEARSVATAKDATT